MSEREHVVASALQHGTRHALRRVQRRVVHVAVRAPRQVHTCTSKHKTVTWSLVSLHLYTFTSLSFSHVCLPAIDNLLQIIVSEIRRVSLLNKQI